MFGREGRIRLFLGFLIFVLVLVNSQSLMVSSRSRDHLEAMFDAAARSSAERIASELNPMRGENDLLALSRHLDEADAKEFSSVCLLDWNATLVTGGPCAPAAGEAFDRLDRDGRRRLFEEGFAMTAVAPAYDVEKAGAFGYLALGAYGASGSPGVLRVEVPAPTLAEANRRFRTILVYQVSALSLVLLALVLFLQSLLAPHRRLVAEARSVASELEREPESRDEGQFLLETFQEIVARLKKKEQELSVLHRIEKARADETEALASDIIRSMTTGLVSLGPSGAVAVVNPAAESIFGLSAPEAVGRPFADVFSGSPELTHLVEEALERGVYHLRGRARYERNEKTWVHLGVSVIPLKTAGDAPRGALCLVADLTEVVDLRERLFLKENLARLGEMAAGIAHEFRNGLATILGNARLLKDGSEGEALELADAVMEEGHSLARVVSEFLQFARPEPLHPETVDVGELLRGLLDELAARAREASVALELDSAGASLEGDESLLRKAFSNLVVNAIESISEAGIADGRVVVEVRAHRDAVLVRVRDNGPGIEPSDRDRIFTPFFTRKEAGTGLGLSVVQKIVVSHNGTVELEETGSGASFLVRLPVESSDTEHPEAWV